MSTTIPRPLGVVPATRRPAFEVSGGFATSLLAIFIVSFVGYLFFFGEESYRKIRRPAATPYASAFSEARFEKVAPGMTRKEVHGLLGTPLRIHPISRGHASYGVPGDEIWSYSTAATGVLQNWSQLPREVVFRKGEVVQRFYWPDRTTP